MTRHGTRGIALRQVERIGRGAPDGGADAVVVEEPIEIRVDGERVATTLRTPGEDGFLALGFLFSEGIVQSMSEIGSVARCARRGGDGSGNVVDVRSGPGSLLDL